MSRNWLVTRRRFLSTSASATVAGAAGIAIPARAWGAEETAAAGDGLAPGTILGDAKGIHPGRVVWIHDPKVAQWDGAPASGGWYEDKFTDPVLAQGMLSRSLRQLTGAKTDAEAWGFAVPAPQPHARTRPGGIPARRDRGRETQLELLQTPSRPRSRVFSTRRS